MIIYQVGATGRDERGDEVMEPENCSTCFAWNKAKTRQGWGKCFELSLEAAKNGSLENEDTVCPLFFLTPFSFGCNVWRSEADPE